jgi:hypothetical protein
LTALIARARNARGAVSKLERGELTAADVCVPVPARLGDVWHYAMSSVQLRHCENVHIEEEGER